MGRKDPFGKGPVRLVSGAWLEERLGKKALCILDVQPDVHDYILEHIHGAFHVNEGLLRVPRNGQPGEYVSPETLHLILLDVGVSANTDVAVYTGPGPR